MLFLFVTNQIVKKKYSKRKTPKFSLIELVDSMQRLIPQIPLQILALQP